MDLPNQKGSDSPKIKELFILDLSLIKAYCEDIIEMFSWYL